MASDRERCLEAGMDSYISKPFDIEMFKRTLSPWVNFSARAKPQVKPQLEEDRRARRHGESWSPAAWGMKSTSS